MRPNRRHRHGNRQHSNQLDPDLHAFHRLQQLGDGRPACAPLSHLCDSARCRTPSSVRPFRPGSRRLSRVPRGLTRLALPCRRVSVERFLERHRPTWHRLVPLQRRLQGSPWLELGPEWAGVQGWLLQRRRLRDRHQHRSVSLNPPPARGAPFTVRTGGLLLDLSHKYSAPRVLHGYVEVV